LAIVISAIEPSSYLKKEGMRNRSTIDISSAVLEAANGGTTKIQIMYRALLSYKQIKVAPPVPIMKAN
jgi:predicted transcriptional regulator